MKSKITNSENQHIDENITAEDFLFAIEMREIFEDGIEYYGSEQAFIDKLEADDFTDAPDPAGLARGRAILITMFRAYCGARHENNCQT